SYWCTTAYCILEWHSAHLPLARMYSALGCAVSTLGRARLIRNAASTRANAMATATKTRRNDIAKSFRKRALRDLRQAHCRLLFVERRNLVCCWLLRARTDGSLRKSPKSCPACRPRQPAIPPRRVAVRPFRDAFSTTYCPIY